MAVEWIVTIFVTVIVGSITYFGTRRHFSKIDTEKARSAKKDIELALSRFIIQHGLNPSLVEIQRMINSKTREYSLSPNKIARPEEIIEDIHTKVIETEYITPKQKEKILPILGKILKVKKEKPLLGISKAVIARMRAEEQKKLLITLSVTGLAVSAILAILTAFFILTF